LARGDSTRSNSRGTAAPASELSKRDRLDEWFASRSFHHSQFSDVTGLARRKRELGVSVSVVLPCREVAATIPAVAAEIEAVNDQARLVDQAIAIDAGSRDGTADAARRAGLEVYDENELMVSFGPTAGKGDAMWRALAVATGDVVVYLDADSANFTRHFVYGLLGPLLTDTRVRFAKATYHRPFRAPGGAIVDEAGRVTELAAKPLLALFHPELSGFGQPLAGELAAARTVLESIPFRTGYGVEVAMLIDVLKCAGLDAMAQVDLGTRVNRSQPLLALAPMAYEVLLAVVARLERDGRMATGHEIASPAGLATYLRAVHEPAGVRLERRRMELVERPPMAQARCGAAR
jgi:glucosyl-3-phosphoglycerate synthase